VPSGGAVPDWNIYRPQWAPVAVANFPSSGNRSLELQDKDPYDYAKAVRVFPESKQVSIRFRAYAKQSDTGELHIEVNGAQGSRPVRLLFAEGGKLKAGEQDIASYKANTWYAVAIDVDAANGKFSVSLDGKPVLQQAAFAEPAATVERLTLRTGAFRTEPTRETHYNKVPDQPNADEPARAAAFFIDDVSAVAK